MRKKGKIYWKDLSKRDLRHLAEYGVRTKKSFTQEMQRAGARSCPRCTAIAQELGL